MREPVYLSTLCLLIVAQVVLGDVTTTTPESTQTPPTPSPIEHGEIFTQKEALQWSWKTSGTGNSGTSSSVAIDNVTQIVYVVNQTHLSALSLQGTFLVSLKVPLSGSLGSSAQVNPNFIAIVPNPDDSSSSSSSKNGSNRSSLVIISVFGSDGTDFYIYPASLPSSTWKPKNSNSQASYKKQFSECGTVQSSDTGSRSVPFTTTSSSLSFLELFYFWCKESSTTAAGSDFLLGSLRLAGSEVGKIDFRTVRNAKALAVWGNTAFAFVKAATTAASTYTFQVVSYSLSTNQGADAVDTLNNVSWTSVLLSSTTENWLYPHLQASATGLKLSYVNPENKQNVTDWSDYSSYSYGVAVMTREDGSVVYWDKTVASSKYWDSTLSDNNVLTYLKSDSDVRLLQHASISFILHAVDPSSGVTVFGPKLLSKMRTASNLVPPRIIPTDSGIVVNVGSTMVYVNQTTGGLVWTYNAPQRAEYQNISGYSFVPDNGYFVMAMSTDGILGFTDCTSKENCEIYIEKEEEESQDTKKKSSWTAEDAAEEQRANIAAGIGLLGGLAFLIIYGLYLERNYPDDSERLSLQGNSFDGVSAAARSASTRGSNSATRRTGAGLGESSDRGLGEELSARDSRIRKEIPLYQTSELYLSEVRGESSNQKLGENEHGTGGAHHRGVILEDQ